MTLRDEVLALYDRLRPGRATNALLRDGLTLAHVKIGSEEALRRCQEALQDEIDHPRRRFRTPKPRVPRPDLKQMGLLGQ